MALKVRFQARVSLLHPTLRRLSRRPVQGWENSGADLSGAPTVWAISEFRAIPLPMPEFIISLIFMSALLVISDRSMPQIAVLYGSGMLSLGPDASHAFYEHYRWVRFPRTLFLILAIFFGSANDLWPNHRDIFLSITLVSFVLWFGSACFDIWKASRAAQPPML